MAAPRALLRAKNLAVFQEHLERKERHTRKDRQPEVGARKAPEWKQQRDMGNAGRQIFLTCKNLER